ncbi:MAG: hypothetical protein ACRES5_34830 [Pseudomonas sp.]|uniref:hypothetical protein n=1 Tax=Stenotrophomonas sp. TaxID=69392 RepID=UPI003D6D52DA
MWNNARAGDSYVEEASSAPKPRTAGEACSLIRTPESPAAHSPSAAPPQPNRIGTPAVGTTDYPLVQPTRMCRYDPQEVDHANTPTLGMPVVHGSAAPTVFYRQLAATPASSVQAGPASPAPPPAQSPFSDSAVTIVWGAYGLNIFVRIKEGDSLNTNDIRKYIIQIVRERDMVIDQLHINGFEASHTLLKEQNHGN